MAKFSGHIGFVISVSSVPGVYKDQATEANYYGDVIQDNRSWTQSTDTLVGDIGIRNKISILANPFAFENISAMKYVVWMGKRWAITNIEVQYPRLILSIGGLYNGIET